MKCGDCKFWGTGDGTGFSYDAGAVNFCKHKLIEGYQHPSSSSYRDDEISKLIVSNMGGPQQILTRYNFGCVLFVQREGK